jgi:alpha-mannosidase
MQEVQVRIDNSDVPANRSVLTVFNACPFPRKGVVSCLVDMPDGFDGESFAVETPAGEPLRVQRRCAFRHDALIRNLQDISAVVSAERTHCHVETGEIPAFGYKTFHIVPSGRATVSPETLAPETNVLENEHLRVRFSGDGTLELTHKETGRVYPGLHYIEDTGETGHSWIHMDPHDNETITSHGGPCALVLEEAGPLLARMRVECRMMIPAGIQDEITPDFHGDAKNHTRRRADRREITVTSRFTLRAGARRLDVTTSLDNTCRDHRMRVVFPTGLTGCDRTDAEAGFDVIGRDIRVKEGNAYFGRPNPQYPMHRFVDMSDGKHGFAVLNASGMREYEAPDLRDRPLAITLFRAINYRNCPSFGRFDVYPEMERAQCPGDLEWTYALYPHRGDWTNGVYSEAEDLNLPLEPAQCGPHEGTLPKELSFLEVTGPLQLTAFKCAEDRPAGYVVRLFNPAGKAAKGELRLWKPVKKAWLTNLNEERREALDPKNGRIALNVPKKKIVTVEFTL